MTEHTSTLKVFTFYDEDGAERPDVQMGIIHVVDFWSRGRDSSLTKPRSEVLACQWEEDDDYPCDRPGGREHWGHRHKLADGREMWDSFGHEYVPDPAIGLVRNGRDSWMEPSDIHNWNIHGFEGCVMVDNQSEWEEIPDKAEFAEAVWNEVSAWAEGEVFGFRVERWTECQKCPDHPHIDKEIIDSLHGIIGYSNLESIITEEMDGQEYELVEQ